jgi:hypothetical protein
VTGDANASVDAPFVVRASAPVRTADVGGSGGSMVVLGPAERFVADGGAPR